MHFHQFYEAKSKEGSVLNTLLYMLHNNYPPLSVVQFFYVNLPAYFVLYGTILAHANKYN